MNRPFANNELAKNNPTTRMFSFNQVKTRPYFTKTKVPHNMFSLSQRRMRLIIRVVRLIIRAAQRIEWRQRREARRTPRRRRPPGEGARSAPRKGRSPEEGGAKRHRMTGSRSATRGGGREAPPGGGGREAPPEGGLLHLFVPPRGGVIGSNIIVLYQIIFITEIKP